MTETLKLTREIKASPEDIWPILSDTSRLNKLMKLNPMSFETHKGVRVGRQKVLFFNLLWTEAPWEWKENEWLKNERIYQKGFFKKLTGTFSISSKSSEISLVTIEFKIEHRFTVISNLLNRATLKIMSKILDLIEKLSAPRKMARSPELHFSSVNDWLIQASPLERSRIAPKRLGQILHTNWKNVLETALAPEQKNRFSLRFDAVCPHCRGAKKSVTSLTDLPQFLDCESCEIDFPVGSQETIEISLKDNSLSLNELDVDFCSADVTHKPQIVLQRVGSGWSEEIELKEGIYFLKKKGEKNAVTLIVDQIFQPQVIDLDQAWLKNDLTYELHTSVNFINVSTEEMIMLERVDEKRGALTLSEALIYPQFSHLIPEKSLIASFPIEMGKKTLMFTDAIGSTDLYYKVGDLEAFKKIRDSFLLIGAEAKKCEGVLVKTIGDATMYAFNDTQKAIECAYNIQHTNSDKEVKLRITLHTGECVSVGTSAGIDFFGDTVNICAKFQAVAEAGDIVFPMDLKSECDITFWRQIERNLIPIHFNLNSEKQRSFDLLKMHVKQI